VSVLLHELGHGLGFLTFMNVNTGAKLLGFNDVFMLNLEDHGAVPPDFPSMTNAQRSFASADTGNLHWVGAHVMGAAAAGALAIGATVDNHVRMYAPNPKQSGSSVSHWDTVLTPSQLMEPIYTGPLPSPVLELPLFQDLGWTAAIPSSPNIHVEPAEKNFGTLPPGGTADQSFRVTNTGSTTLHVSAASIVVGAGTNPPEFAITSGVTSFSLAANDDIAVAVRFAPDASGGDKSAVLRFVSDDPDQPTRDVPLIGVVPAPKHDLAVVKITAPALVSVTSAPVTKPVTVQIQNRSDHAEVLSDATILGNGTTTGLVQLVVSDIIGDEGCLPAVVVLDPAKKNALFRSGPKTIASKGSLTISYKVTYHCTNAKTKAASGAGNYSYQASVHHELLGAPDGHAADDVCPRGPLGFDPNPDGSIKDKGCSVKPTNVTGK
jgi:hypothetical protein